MIKVGFVSLGCAKNLVDTETMLGILTTHGMQIIDNPEDADILIVNTCSFIDAAKEESITTILQMAEFKKHHDCKGLIVAGCLGQRYRQELLDELPEVDAIIGTGAWHRIVEAVDSVLAGERVLLIGSDDIIYDHTTPRITTSPGHSAYIKIAEGCSNHCSYCVIPKVRGRFRSRPAESVVAEVKRLTAGGVKEINLIAQDTTSYGRDLCGKPQLTTLLRELVKIEDLTWIRLLYCYPTYFDDELIDLMAAEPKICNYVDLPLQHAHDEILKQMNRRDTKADIETLLRKLRAKIPGVAIRTTFIVGFPGETEEHFQTLRDFILEQRFDHVGIFTYSQEEDTVAGAMEGQIPETVKQERYHELMAIQSKISEEINQSLENTVFDVLIEGKSAAQPEILVARSYREAPDVDGRVYIENAGNAAVGDMMKVRIVQGFAYDLVAEKTDC
ncbi:MAG: 30S ribosomal protein S12 methylthiotransferase RimO [Negativicutes bacterium]|nr:30S ribosomal protein S12 methylthiotransferase RimO [Negativicutes bacterium]